MFAVTVPIVFFIPKPLWPSEIPASADENWAGYGLGLYAWTVQTYLRLSAAGVNCQLASDLPEEGIVLCHGNALRTAEIKPSAKRLLVCMKAEGPLSAAPFHIVQNPTEASCFANRYFIPHWPQPQLFARDKDRGDRFENLAFFGHQDNLAKELQSYAWQVALAERGLRGRVVANSNPWNQYQNLNVRWNDYRDVDAVVAVRSFSPWRRWHTGRFSNKPATKLYNAWLAGAIALLGVESAYRKTGQPDQDYIEVESFKALLASLDRLKTDPALRRSLVTQGTLRSREYTPERIVRKWQVFLEAVAIPAYKEWIAGPNWHRQKSLLLARSANRLDRVARQGRRVLFDSFHS